MSNFHQLEMPNENWIRRKTWLQCILPYCFLWNTFSDFAQIEVDVLITILHFYCKCIFFGFRKKQPFWGFVGILRKRFKKYADQKIRFGLLPCYAGKHILRPCFILCKLNLFVFFARLLSFSINENTKDI